MLREFSVFGVSGVQNNAKNKKKKTRKHCTVAVGCPEAATEKKVFPDDMVDDQTGSLLGLLLGPYCMLSVPLAVCTYSGGCRVDLFSDHGCFFWCY